MAARLTRLNAGAETQRAMRQLLPPGKLPVALGGTRLDGDDGRCCGGVVHQPVRDVADGDQWSPLSSFAGVSTAEVNAVLKLRARLGPELLAGRPDHVAGDIALLRWLRRTAASVGARGACVSGASDEDLLKAEGSVRELLAWRDEHGVEAISQTIVNSDYSFNACQQFAELCFALGGALYFTSHICRIPILAECSAAILSGRTRPARANSSRSSRTTRGWAARACGLRIPSPSCSSSCGPPWTPASARCSTRRTSAS